MSFKAMLSNLGTPKAWKGSEGSDMDEKEGALLRPNSDASPSGMDGDGQVRHLGDDLPDVPAESGIAQTFDPPSNQASTSRRRSRQESPNTHTQAKMGANNSHEEIGAAVRATAAELQERNVSRKSDGKLKRPSSGTVTKNPPYRAPFQRPVQARRHMAPSQHAQPDTYDLHDSPEKAARLPTKHVPSKPISPLKSQKKAAKQVARSPAVESLEDKRAKHQQMMDEQLLGSNSAAERERQGNGPSKQDKDHEHRNATGVTELNTQAAHIQNWFRDPAVPSTRRSVARVEVGALAHNDFGAAETEDPPMEPEVEVDVVEDAAPQNAPKRKRGRPRKQLYTTPQEWLEQTEKEKTGRLRKSTSPDTSTRTLDARPGVKATAAGQTAALPTASKSPQKPKKQSSTRAQRQINDRKAADEEETTSRTEQPAHGDVGDTIAVAGAEDDAPVLDGDRADAEYTDGGGDDGGFQPNNIGEDEDEEADAAVEDDDEEEEEGDDEAQTIQPVTRKAVILPPSAVFDGATGDALSNSSPAQRPRQLLRKRKIRDDDDEETATANTSKKRQQTAPPPPADCREVSPQPSVEEPLGDNRDFYGQSRVLRKVFRAHSKIGIRYIEGEPRPKIRIKLRDADVKAIIDLCDDTMDSLFEGDDPVAGFISISEKVDALYKTSADSEPEFTNTRKAKDIYFHLFPKLVKVLEHIIDHHTAADELNNPARPLTIGHLKNVRTFIRVIVDLGEGAKKYPRPVGLAAIQPVEQGIVAPLRRVNEGLRKVLVHHQRDVDHKENQQREAEERALEAQREEQEERQAAHVKRVRDKWHQLHEERVWAEGGIISAQKRRHLKVPDPLPEVDQNGVRFERLEVFAPRIGPSPAMVEAARGLVWTMSELDALAEGLKLYKGPHVLEKVFRRHCKKYGLLRNYNVTEIVTVAGALKDYLTNIQQEQNGGVEGWVRGIPVWTKGHPLGKENTAGDGEGDE